MLKSQEWRPLIKFIKKPFLEEKLRTLDSEHRYQFEEYVQQYLDLKYTTVKNRLNAGKYNREFDWISLIKLMRDLDILFPFEILPINVLKLKKKSITITDADRTVEREGRKQVTKISPKLQTVILLSEIKRNIFKKTFEPYTEENMPVVTDAKAYKFQNYDQLAKLLSPVLLTEEEYEEKMEVPTSIHANYLRWRNKQLKPLVKRDASLLNEINKLQTTIANMHMNIAPFLLDSFKAKHEKELETVLSDILAIGDLTILSTLPPSSSQTELIKARAQFVKGFMNTLLDNIMDENLNDSEKNKPQNHFFLIKAEKNKE